MSAFPAVTPDLVFSCANAVAGACWIALAASPAGVRWAPRTRFVTGRVVPLLFAAVYVLLFATTGLHGGGYDSLVAVQRLMAVPTLLTAGWLHYLAFDLFVGTWIAERAASLGMPHLLVLPLLALTFLFGPAGLLAFAVLRAVRSTHPASSAIRPMSPAGHRIDPPLARWPRELFVRDRRLAIFGTALLALMVPMTIAALVDDRTLRGADVWIKPIKFALSIALLSFTTAWFAGHLPADRRKSAQMRLIAWLVIGAGGFELAYITLQAALGQASHYNVGDPLHAAMYALMGVGALVLTATQPMLAWQLYRHPDPSRPEAYRQAILIGLVLTFVLGAGVGGLLAGLQPPSGDATVPVFGWSLAGGDLRPAHFAGIHAEQLMPLVGLVGVALGPRHAKTLVWVAALVYVGLFTALVAWGLAGRL